MTMRIEGQGSLCGCMHWDSLHGKSGCTKCECPSFRSRRGAGPDESAAGASQAPAVCYDCGQPVEWAGFGWIHAYPRHEAKPIFDRADMGQCGDCGKPIHRTSEGILRHSNGPHADHGHAPRLWAGAPQAGPRRPTDRLRCAICQEVVDYFGEKLSHVYPQYASGSLHAPQLSEDSGAAASDYPSALDDAREQTIHDIARAFDVDVELFRTQTEPPVRLMNTPEVHFTTCVVVGGSDPCDCYRVTFKDTTPMRPAAAKDWPFPKGATVKYRKGLADDEAEWTVERCVFNGAVWNVWYVQGGFDNADDLELVPHPAIPPRIAKDTPPASCVICGEPVRYMQPGNVLVHAPRNRFADHAATLDDPAPQAHQIEDDRPATLMQLVDIAFDEQTNTTLQPDGVPPEAIPDDTSRDGGTAGHPIPSAPPWEGYTMVNLTESQECDICGALVLHRAMTRHRDWHHDNS